MAERENVITGIGSLLGAIAGGTGLLDQEQRQMGYQGGIPQLTALREQIPYGEMTDVNRRPGSVGRRYFTDTVYAQSPAGQVRPTLAQGQQQVSNQMQALLNRQPYSPPSYIDYSGPSAPDQPPAQTPNFSEALGRYWANNPDKLREAVASNPTAFGLTPPPPAQTNSFAAALEKYWSDNPDKLREAVMMNPSAFATGGQQNFAAGGIASLGGKGYYLGGPTDGMADKVPAKIDGQQPAALSDGEFVIPADVVSHLGNGNSTSGARQLYQMMERIRKARTGSPKQGKQINPTNMLPK